MAVHQITPIDGEMGDFLHKIHDKYRYFLNVDGCILPQTYTKFADRIENLEARDDDVWVCSFPKTGTTWTQEMVWCIVNDLDFEGAKVPLDQRFPAIYLPIPDQKNATEVKLENIPVDSVSRVESLPSPRFIKSHLPFNLLPHQLRSGEKKSKIVYVTRNPKDTCISCYHFFKLISARFEASFEEYCTLFLGDTVVFGPFWTNVLSFWNRRNYDNMLFLKYEDMIEDLPSVIRRTATFLGKNLTNDQVSLLTDQLGFSKMKANSAVNFEAHISNVHKLLQVEREGKFMRNGTSGQWKTAMTPEIIKRFDDWSLEHLNGTGLSL